MDRVRASALLAVVNGHIAETDAFIREHQAIVERLAAEGHNTDDARASLNALRGSLSAFETHKRLLLAELGRRLH
jgi:hypothetical protein